MGKVSGNWITGTHSGRACKHDDIYTKVNKRTGACYSVKLCNPVTEQNEEQLKSTNAFSLVSSAISSWIKTEKASQSADYKKVQKAFEAQKKYSYLRSFMFAKGMYTVSADKATVTVDITKRTDFKTAFGIESGSGSDGGAQSGGTSTVKRTLTLSASPSNGGTVSGAGQYNNGASATITATANSGYTFTRWSDGNTSASRTVVMDANKTLSAIFTANAGGGGSTDDDDEVNNLH